jgi:hypothetical protein
MIKIIFTLVLFVAVGVLTATTGVGEGFFEFNYKARAERVVNEARAIDEAMKSYAAGSDTGEVDFGDPSEGEDVLMYIKARDLIQDRVGTENDLVEEWVLSDDKKRMQGVVRTDKICKYINESKHGRDADLPTPSCGTDEGNAVTCCSGS